MGNTGEEVRHVPTKFKTQRMKEKLRSCASSIVVVLASEWAGLLGQAVAVPSSGWQVAGRGAAAAAARAAVHAAGAAPAAAGGELAEGGG